jgi:hypothetical protein
LPPPLPPAARTVGQLVAESLRLYGSRFFVCLALGLPVAVIDQLLVDRPTTERVIVLLAAGPLFSIAFAGACAIRAGSSPPARHWGRAIVAGSLTFLPAALLLPWFALAGVAYLALVGQAVPAIMAEGVGFGAGLRRGVVLGRADIGHAVGGLATLSLLFGLTRLVLGLLLRSQADNTLRVSIFLADVVISPILFLGAALLYVDLAARVGLTRADRARLRGEAIRGAR